MSLPNVPFSGPDSHGSKEEAYHAAQELRHDVKATVRLQREKRRHEKQALKEQHRRERISEKNREEAADLLFFARKVQRNRTPERLLVVIRRCNWFFIGIALVSLLSQGTIFGAEALIRTVEMTTVPAYLTSGGFFAVLAAGLLWRAVADLRHGPLPQFSLVALWAAVLVVPVLTAIGAITSSLTWGYFAFSLIVAFFAAVAILMPQSMAEQYRAVASKQKTASSSP